MWGFPDTEKKICGKCGKELPLTEFYKDYRREGRYKPICKACWAIRKKEYKEKNRERIAESDRRYYEANKDRLIQRKIKWQKENRERVSEQQRARREIGNERLLRLKTPCVKCGEKRPWVIQFHHIDQTKKEFMINISTVMSKEWEEVLEEVSKCACLCANCHTEFHYLHRKKKGNPVEVFEKYLRGDIGDTERTSRN